LLTLLALPLISVVIVPLTNTLLGGYSHVNPNQAIHAEILETRMARELRQRCRIVDKRCIAALEEGCISGVFPAEGSPAKDVTREKVLITRWWRRWDSNPRPPACKYARPGRWRTLTDGYGRSGFTSGRSRTVADGCGWYMNGPSQQSGRQSSGL
jgi:hypothetical protein